MARETRTTVESISDASGKTTPQRTGILKCDSPGSGGSRLEVSFSIHKTQQGYSSQVGSDLNVGRTYRIDCMKLQNALPADCGASYHLQQEIGRRDIMINETKATIYRYSLTQSSWQFLYRVAIPGKPKGYGGNATTSPVNISMFVSSDQAADFDAIAAVARSISVDRARSGN